MTVSEVNIKNEKDPKYKYGPKFDKPKNEDNPKTGDNGIPYNKVNPKNWNILIKEDDPKFKRAIKMKETFIKTKKKDV